MDESTPSTPASALVRKGILKRQARAIVFNVFENLKRKKQEENSRENVRELTSELTGISSRTVGRIVQEANRMLKETGSVKFVTPSKSKPHRKRIILDSFDEALLRNKIREFYLKKRVPTIKAVLQSLKQDGVIDCGAESLRLRLKDCGFESTKCQNKRRLLMERSDIAAWRALYLRKIRKYRSEGRNIVYLHETSVNDSHDVNKSSSAGEPGAVSRTGNGNRLILVHGGGEMGFVADALLIFKPSSKSVDYHSAENFDNFSKWLTETFLPNLPERSVIVLDSAEYNNVEINSKPDAGSPKTNIAEWLTKNDINFDETMTKAELLELVAAAPVEKTYKVDSIIHSHGHEAVRLPPYHSELNPMELVWGYLKSKLAMESVGTQCGMETRLRKLFTDYSLEQWRKVCGRVIKNEENYIFTDPIIEEMTDCLITNGANALTSTDSSDDSDDE